MVCKLFFLVSETHTCIFQLWHRPKKRRQFRIKPMLKLCDLTNARKKY
jgi:hypothetical protein